MQGTRQGSICAPFYYTIHVNGLLDELQRSDHGLMVGELKLSAPTQADDIVLLSTSRLGAETTQTSGAIPITLPSALPL